MDGLEALLPAGIRLGLGGRAAAIIPCIPIYTYIYIYIYAPSDGSTLGETAIGETAYDDLVGDDDDSDNSC